MMSIFAAFLIFLLINNLCSIKTRSPRALDEETYELLLEHVITMKPIVLSKKASQWKEEFSVY